jgi:hypothetical protein
MIKASEKTDPLSNVFGVVRIAIDKIQELETRGQIYGFSKYLPNSVIVMKTVDFPLLVDVYIPEFPFYFQFAIIKDEKTHQIFIDDMRVVYPSTNVQKADTMYNNIMDEDNNSSDEQDE